MQEAEERLTRRTFIAGAGAVAAASLAARNMPALAAAGTSAASLGEWIEDDYGLPAYNYAGPMRFPDSPKRDGAAMIPDDPYFLTGNQRMTVFTHASGLYQLITGDRSWGRMNQRDERWGGANSASVEIADKRYELVGPDAPAAVAATKRFGVGFARWDYSLAGGVTVTRRLSVAPSTKLGAGTPAVLMQVTLKNAGTAEVKVKYAEFIRAKYQQLFAEWDLDQRGVSWQVERVMSGDGVLAAHFNARAKRKLTFPPAGEMSRYEQFPPVLFVKAVTEELKTATENGTGGQRNIGVNREVTIGAGESASLAFVVGYTRDMKEIDAIAARLAPPASSKAVGSAFGDAWVSVVPKFSNESDPGLRREMVWNAAVLESMATWREYYDETVIPQGTMYDYVWGNMASSRDLAQQALPFCHTNAAIARSTLRFIMKRMLPDGTVQLNDEGFGWVPSGAQQTSDQQLYFFLLMAEYLRKTRDAAILSDTIGYYPLENAGRDTGIAHVRKAFLFLRDRVGTATHGIVCRWNSDWNDMFCWWPSEIPYGVEFAVGESHMNSAMAIVVLGDIANEIEKLKVADADELVAAMREYRGELLEAWNRDLGDRDFPRRAWMDATIALGEDNMWLEPQGYTLLIPEMSGERKRRLYGQMRSRVLDHEVMGARQIEKPSPQSGTPQGSRENGGFWYALNGPVVLGVDTFDAAAARGLLKKMTFANYAEHFPEYWTGRWSAGDSIDSSLLPTQGLGAAMPWCAHAHAWPLYCYLRLNEDGKSETRS